MQEIREKVREAEFVLVGLGEGFQYDWSALQSDARYREIEAEVGEDENHRWIVPFLQKMALRQGMEERWKKAYQALAALLAGKNYFVLSLCMDDYLYGTGLDEGRLATPCGGFRRMQCDDNCAGDLMDMPEAVYEAALQYYRGELPFERLEEPRCAKCGGKLRFNQLGVSRYAQEGYLEQWSRYTRWLQGTVNRKLCMLELGAGMAYPGIVRFPFEKMARYNKKAFLCRIHPLLSQLGEEIAGQGRGIAENPVDFLVKWGKM